MDYSKVPLKEMLETSALLFAHAAHAGVGQRRKYTGEHYIVHPYSVYRLMSRMTKERHILDAAALHDVLEDTQVEYGDLEDVFGTQTANLVLELTNQVPKSAGNRETRHALELERLSEVSYWAKNIKIVDSIDNINSIVAHDPEFAKVYLKEKALLLRIFATKDVDHGLLFRLESVIERARRSLGHAAGT